MLLPTAQLLKQAEAGEYAVGAFNTYNLVITRAIIKAAENCKAPVILQVGSAALKQAGREALAASMLAEAVRSPVPVAVHLDHSTQISDVDACLDLGFSSIMIDGSELSFNQNVALTIIATEKAHGLSRSVEAELGKIVGQEDVAGYHLSGSPTDPAEAATFVEATGVDALAVCIGNVHGLYREAPALDFDRLSQICARVATPIVLHGASGLPDKTVREAIELGVRKMNVNTELRGALLGAFSHALPQAQNGYNVMELFAAGEAAVRDLVEEKIELFGGAGAA